MSPGFVAVAMAVALVLDMMVALRRASGTSSSWFRGSRHVGGRVRSTSSALEVRVVGSDATW